MRRIFFKLSKNDRFLCVVSDRQAQQAFPCDERALSGAVELFHGHQELHISRSITNVSFMATALITKSTISNSAHLRNPPTQEAYP